MTGASVLDAILGAKRREVDARRRRTPIESLRESAALRPAPRGFRRAIGDVLRDARRIAVIGEVKRRSPSAGALRPDADLAAIAGAYERGGACALSVLTDAAHFGGSDDDLARCREATALPVLRKDFLVDPYQVMESRAIGADAVLLIVRALSEADLRALHAHAAEMGLDAIVEVHDEEDLERALALPDPLIGINNRDLATMTTDIAVTERLVARLASRDAVISESGVETAGDVRRLARGGVRAFLVGTALLRSPDPEAKVRELVEALA